MYGGSFKKVEALRKLKHFGMCLSSVSQSEAEIRSGWYRDMGAVKKGVVPRNVTVVTKSTRVNFLI